jgi:geranylgeranyl pyrophosphate synthase
VAYLAGLLVEEGARQYTEEQAEQYTRQSLQSLINANIKNEAGQALQELALMLLKRSS